MLDKKKIAIIVLDQRTNRSDLSRLQSDEFYYVLFTQKAGIKALGAESKAVFSEIVAIDKDCNAIELTEKVEPYLDRVDKENLHLITSREVFMQRVAEVQEMLSLPGVSLGKLLPFKDKLIMKDVVSSAGIRTPWHIAFDASEYNKKGQDYLAEIDHIVKDTINYPVFVKPIAEEGAIDSKKIDDFDALKHWAESAHMDQFQYELDEYISGALYHVDSIIKNGEVLYTSFSLYSHPVSFFSEGKPVGSFDILDDDPVCKELDVFNRKVISALSAPDGVTHNEIFRTVSGELIFLEIGARPPGGYTCQVHERNTGINLETAHLRVQLGLPVHLQDDYSKGFCTWLYFPRREGTVTKLNEPDIESCYDIAWYVKVGEVLANSKHIASDSELAGLIFLYNEDYEQLRHDFLVMKDFVALEVK